MTTSEKYRPGWRTHESLLEAAHYVETIEKRQGQKIACLEEIAWQRKWLSKAQLLAAAERLAKNGYGEYLRQLAAQNSH
mgnify:CR=1 FL=1